MNSSIRPFVLGSIIYLITYFIPFLPIIHFYEGENQESTKIEISITGFDLITKSAAIKGEPTEDKDFKKHEYLERMYEVKKEKIEDGNINNTKDKQITYPYYGWIDKLPTVGAILSILLVFFYYGKYHSLIYWTKIFLLSVLAICFLRYGFINLFLNRQFTVFPLGVITLIISYLLIAFDKNNPEEETI
ncbi:MAG: hypothetical protein ACKO1R_03170 [Crocinitomicaceae bacterium]